MKENNQSTILETCLSLACCFLHQGGLLKALVPQNSSLLPALWQGGASPGHPPCPTAQRWFKDPSRCIRALRTSLCLENKTWQLFCWQ